MNYNSWWNKYLNTNIEEPGTKYRKKEILKLLLKYKKRNCSILDSGCGAGELINFLIENKISPGTISGCDISDFIIKRNKKNLKKVNFFVCNLETGSNLGRKKYDIVICSEVIEHVRGWKDMIKNLSKLLTKDGTIILSTQSGKIFGHQLELGHLKHFTVDELCEELEKNQIAKKEAYTCGWPFMNFKNLLVNMPILKTRERMMRSGAKSRAQKIQFSLFDLAYKISSRAYGPQIFIVAKKSN